MTDNAVCGNCRFYLKMPDPKVPGVCRRFPPSVFPGEAKGQGQGWLSQYPPMWADGWCGEHKPALAS